MCIDSILIVKMHLSVHVPAQTDARASTDKCKLCYLLHLIFSGTLSPGCFILSSQFSAFFFSPAHQEVTKSLRRPAYPLRFRYAGKAVKVDHKSQSKRAVLLSSYRINISNECCMGNLTQESLCSCFSFCFVCLLCYRADLPLTAHTEQGFPLNMYSVCTCLFQYCPHLFCISLEKH